MCVPAAARGAVAARRTLADVASLQPLSLKNVRAFSFPPTCIVLSCSAVQWSRSVDLQREASKQCSDSGFANGAGANRGEAH